MGTFFSLLSGFDRFTDYAFIFRCRRLDRGEEVEGMRERPEALEQTAELEGVKIDELRERKKGFRFAY